MVDSPPTATAPWQGRFPPGIMRVVCLAIYLATDAELPVVAWDKSAPGFNVRRPKRKRVPGDFKTEYVYEVGAHTGCACGFLMDGNGSDDAEKTARSRAALRASVEQATERGAVQLLVCWIGDETKAARTLVMSPEELVSADFDCAWDQPIRIDVRAR
jgi:hypothetical protein